MMRLAGHDLDCVRGDRKVLAGINFSADAGEPLAVTGRNGAGKTTLLRLIAGLLEPAQGRIELTGGTPDLTVAEQAHYLGHRDALKPALSVSENLRFWYAFLGGGDASVASTLDAVGLGGLADLPAGYLSAGQRRRLSIARLLAAPRPIWLLDEPSAALDTAGQQRLAELMQAHLAGGGILIAATHGPLGLPAKEFRLESQALPQAQRAPSPTELGPARVPHDAAQVGQARLATGEGWGGGWPHTQAQAAPPTPSPSPPLASLVGGGEKSGVATPTPGPSPQGGGEKSGGEKRR